MKRAKSLSIFIVFILCIPGLIAVADTHNNQTEKQTPQTNGILNIPAEQSGVVLTSLKNLSPVDPNMSMNVLVTLGFRNQGLLNSTLLALQNPLSADYHKYLSKNSFISEFSPSAQEYDSYVNYFRSQGLNVTNTYSDRISIGISSNASLLEKVFHTSIVYHESNGSRFYAPNSNLSIDANFGTITGLNGLSDQFKISLSPMFSGGGSTQTLYGADLQNAYQLNKLYQSKGYPTGETIATILWTGTNSAGASVAPFIPSDISTYFANNLPAGEPRSKVYGLPVGGAPLPGPSAANDTTQTNYESTLDLEMAGSTAPGATLVEVYGPQATMTYLDEAFAQILNPSYNSTVDSALSHVVAISNSWGGTDSTDSSWTQYEQEAAVRGITILASSGDSGNSNSVSPSFPATEGYNGYGTLAVGGTQTVLAGSASTDGTGTTGISSQAVWYNTPNTGDGSQGGVSSVYSEPSWQVNSSDASGVIGNASTITGLQSGRGTPDIAGIGANMLIYITVSGSSGYLELWGTSVASPLVAGVIATIDQYSGTQEGFLNPFIYEIGQDQYQGTYAGPSPFYFIYNGSNGAFSSGKGYNLVDGWGSINAYNFIIAQEGVYTVTFNEAGLPSGTEWFVNLSTGHSFSSTGSTISFLLANGSYNYSVVSTLKSYTSTSGSFTVSGTNLTQNIVFKNMVYTVNFTESGLPSGNWYINISGNSESTSAGSIISYSLTNGTYNYTVATDNREYAPSAYDGSFSVHGSNLNVSVITFSPVTYRVTFNEGGLPQGAKWFVNLSDGLSESSSSTSISFYLANGSYNYSVSSTLNGYDSVGGTLAVIGASVVENIVFTLHVYTVDFSETGLGSGDWFVNISGSSENAPAGSSISYSLTNGTYKYTIATDNRKYSPSTYSGNFTVQGSNQSVPVIIFSAVTYQITFAESGLPSGSFWQLELLANYYTNNTGSVTLNLQNGTYYYNATSLTSSAYICSGGFFTVNGANLEIQVLFEKEYSVNFTETGLPPGIKWYVTFNGITNSSSAPAGLSFYVLNGSYNFDISSLQDYHPVSASGTIKVSGNNVTHEVNFVLSTFNVTFKENGLPAGTAWYINFTSGPGSYSISKLETSGVSMIIYLPNGSYSFEAASSNKSYRSTGSSFIVQGSNISISVDFTAVTYDVSFQETGLTTGGEWRIALNGQYYSSNSDNLQFSGPNGTYSYSVSPESGFRITNSTGIFTISGGSVTIHIVFSPVLYNLSFKESGLPNDSSQKWGIYVNGTAYFSYGPYINLTVSNGEYHVYSINGSKYYAVLQSNLVTINGSNLTLVVSYSPYAFINISIIPTDATVFVDGVLVSTTGGHLNLSVLPGLHSVEVKEYGYTSYYNNSTIAGGQALDLQVTLHANQAPMSTQTVILIGIAAIIPVAVIAYYLSRRRR